MNERDRSKGAFSRTQPLAQEFTVVYQTPTKDIRTDAPSLLQLPNGSLLCAFSLVERKLDDRTLREGKPEERKDLGSEIIRSLDRGRTWEHISHVDLDAGIMFLHEGEIFFLCNRGSKSDVVLTSSDDGGSSWRPEVTIREGLFWNTSTGYARKNGKLYWALGQANTQGRYNKRGSRLVGISGDLSRDLMDPSSWSFSNSVTYPGTPDALTRKLYSTDAKNEEGDHWLEPNMVSEKDRLLLMARVRIDRYATSGVAAVCDLVDTGQSLELGFTQFYPAPGAQNNFFILNDEVANLFWMTSNLPTRTQDLEFQKELSGNGFKGTPGNERRLLMLSYSLDALNWFPAGCLAMWPSPLQAFNYATLMIDGDDLLFACRTASQGINQHDNDLVTFHRLPQFRSCALDLKPHYA